MSTGSPSWTRLRAVHGRTTTSAPTAPRAVLLAVGCGRRLQPNPEEDKDYKRQDGQWQAGGTVPREHVAEKVINRSDAIL
jgi:hypothetical protein